MEGIEPSTSRSRTERSTDELHSGVVVGGQAEPCVLPTCPQTLKRQLLQAGELRSLSIEF